MNIEELKSTLEKIKKSFKNQKKDGDDKESWNDLRVKYLGRKSKIKELFGLIGEFDPEERKKVGKMINDHKDYIEKEIALLKNKIEKEEEKIKYDITLPPRKRDIGKEHPITSIFELSKEIFSKMGFDIKTGPEIEEEWYNFDALNIPESHPARDEQDTFYINEEKKVLRTHTSPVQIRTMLEEKPPLAMIAPGKVYRSDTIDASHSPVFHQIEGLLIDENVKFSDLKGVLYKYLSELFNDNSIKLRFYNNYFPFTEPSAEMHMNCIFCKGEGCKVCKNSGWIELLGCGMVDPNVFKAVDIDPEKYTGFAFGVGVERLALLKYNIPDMRYFYENDLRMLNLM
ncbi:MAG: phenylalanine--tRNA ligase subunit alpha [Candidatus Mcinerneyibacterium aminivorans]|uniref:Phenylalanine--tRNA ligase alpha subunit n=1 Tax=Candidatus Mcinerneyibacterium aminivorans TaxID=2703815 RepID=A0A5D0M9P6_9BACT|nr:MAG: phenylalanine--tRNA ligase subunit alpha [Candidatus Mcinerneyibacterium aminivorans]